MGTGKYVIVGVSVVALAVAAFFVSSQVPPSTVPASREAESKPLSPPKTFQVVMNENAFQGPQGWRGERVFDDKYYHPNTIVIRVGDSIEWINKDLIGHSVTFEKGMRLDSGLFQPAQSWTHTFDAPGEYEYYCTPHPHMAGRVVVER